ncbi:MAG: aminotransferase class V-fold PLP-dependent enzyme [Coriobacteriia bacterium]
MQDKSHSQKSTQDKHEQALIRYLLEGLSTIPKIRIYGNHQYADDRCGIAAFNYTSADPKTVSDFLDRNFAKHFHGYT